MATCHICGRNGDYWRCPKCGRIACSQCHTSECCLQCQPVAPPPRVATTAQNPINKAPSITALGIIAMFLLVIGITTTLYFMFAFDVSVAAPGVEAIGIESGRVNNFGLMADKQNGLICGFGFTFLGLALGIWDHTRRYKA